MKGPEDGWRRMICCDQSISIRIPGSAIYLWFFIVLVIDNTQAGIAVSSGIAELAVGNDPGVIPEKESQVLTRFPGQVFPPQIKVYVPGSLFRYGLIIAELEPVI